MTSFDQFIAKYPQYLRTSFLDELRTREYGILDQKAHVYLDYTGAGLYAASQLREHQSLLAEHVFGNPHSYNPTSLLSTRLVDETRQRVLRFFNAADDEYVCIFTQNASAALKLVGEAYPFGEGCRYLLTFDNHNSVNGIREYARVRGASVTYIPVVLPDLRIDANQLLEQLRATKMNCHQLLAYPAQSNFSGVKHPLEWIEQAHELGWNVLLDAAAYVPSNQLDLSRWKPDYVPISFYKMFGYPTGIGALIARRQALYKLSRCWFAGGTTSVASVRGNKYYPAEAPAAFEDGTLDYLNIPAVAIGLDHIQSITYPMIHERIQCLTGWLLDRMNAIQHANGQPLVKIYGPLTTDARGGTIAVNFFDREGKIIEKRRLEQEANQRNISIRMGFFCNPGAGEVALEISGEELSSCFSRPTYVERITDLDFQRCIDPKASGAVRISVGLVSNFADLQTFLEFVQVFVE